MSHDKNLKDVYLCAKFIADSHLFVVGLSNLSCWCMGGGCPFVDAIVPKVSISNRNWSSIFFLGYSYRATRGSVCIVRPRLRTPRSWSTHHNSGT